LTIGSSFSNDPTVCPPNSEPCTEVFSMQCICYDGEDIAELDIKRGDRLEEILQKLILAVRYPNCSVFEDPTFCQSALNVTFTNITASSFVISWDAVVAATDYQVEFKLVTDLSWTSTVTIPTTSATIITLAADTIYDVRVKVNCPGDTCYSLNYRIKTLES
jgi:hypothetical protein